MAKNFSFKGEKSVLSKLLGREMKKTASSDTLAENREQLALEAKAITEKTPLDPRGYKTRESGPVKHTPDYSTTNRDQIVAAAGKELSRFISDKVGRGGYNMEEVEFKKLDSRASHSDSNLQIINRAIVAFKVNFTTSAKEKSCFAAVKYENDKNGDSFTIENYFVDCVDTNKKIQSSRKELEAYLTSTPSNFSFDRKLVYFDISNPENQTWKQLAVKNVAKAKARLESAGFEIQAKVLGRENNITGPVYELVIHPEKYLEAKKVLASEWEKVDLDIKSDEKFEKSKGNEPGVETDNPRNWQDRSLEKNAPEYMKPIDASQPKEKDNKSLKDDVHEWQDRSLSKNDDKGLGLNTVEKTDTSVKSDEKFEKQHGNTPMDSDPKTWQDRSLDRMKTPPEAKTLLKYQRKNAQLIEQIETAPESVLTPPLQAPNEIPMEAMPPMDIKVDAPAPASMPGEETEVDKIITMLEGANLSYEEIHKIEKVLEEKEEESVGEEKHQPGEEAGKSKDEKSEEEIDKDIKEEEKKEEPKEEKKEEKEEKKVETEAAKKTASKVEVKASTKKLASFVCACGSYLSTPSCDCASPKLTALGQVTDPNTGNPAQPDPNFSKNNATKQEVDGLDHGKTAAEGDKAKVVPSNEVKSQAHPGAKPQSLTNPPRPNEEELSTKQTPMTGMEHGKSSDEGKSTEPPHGKDKGAWDGLNEANMVDMAPLKKDKTPADGMDHGKTNDGPAAVVPSKEVPSLKASLTPGDKSFQKVFRVSAAKRVEALKSEIIDLWDKGIITLDQANLRIAAAERTAQHGAEELGRDEVKPEANKYFLDENMGKDFKDYQDKNWFNRSMEKNPWDGHKRNVDSNDETLEKEPTKDIESWDTRSLEKNPDTTVKTIDIPKTSSEVKPKEDEAYEKRVGNEPTKDDVTQWPDRSLEKRTVQPSNEKLMWL